MSHRESPAEAIRRHYRRGMSQTILERIYGAQPVREIIGLMPAPVDKPAFPKRLAAMRRQEKLSIAAVATKLGVHPEHVARYEEGIRKPSSPKIILKIAEFLGEDAAALAAELEEE